MFWSGISWLPKIQSQVHAAEITVGGATSAVQQLPYQDPSLPPMPAPLPNQFHLYDHFSLEQSALSQAAEAQAHANSWLQSVPSMTQYTITGQPLSLTYQPKYLATPTILPKRPCSTSPKSTRDKRTRLEID